tara:strand:+ start:1223 stop:1732 length:510 start_codon:yes stop_codon:yes gene_type:complete
MDDLKIFRNFCNFSNLDFLFLEKYATRYKPINTAEYPFTGELRLIKRGSGYFDSSEFRDSVISQLIFDTHVVTTLFTDLRIEVAEFANSWVSVHEIESIYLTRGLTIIERGGTSEERSEQFLSALRTQRQRRMRRFKVCQYCNERTPPFYLHGNDCCMSCAEKHFGIIH